MNNYCVLDLDGVPPLFYIKLGKTHVEQPDHGTHHWTEEDFKIAYKARVNGHYVIIEDGRLRLGEPFRPTHR